MALKDKWVDRVNSESTIDASDINLIAEEVIETQEKVAEMEENGDAELSEKVDALDERVTSLETPAKSITNVSVKDIASTSASNISFTDNSIICEGGGSATLNVQGEFDIEFDGDNAIDVMVDGVNVYYYDIDSGGMRGNTFYKGTITENIKVSFIGYSPKTTITFSKFEKITYKDGLMTAEQSEKLDEAVSDILEIEANIGDIDTILDSIIAKQEAYISTAEETSEGGDAE